MAVLSRPAWAARVADCSRRRPGLSPSFSEAHHVVAAADFDLISQAVQVYYRIYWLKPERESGRHELKVS